jgi:hypothetical protein
MAPILDAVGRHRACIVLGLILTIAVCVVGGLSFRLYLELRPKPLPTPAAVTESLTAAGGPRRVCDLSRTKPSFLNTSMELIMTHHIICKADGFRMYLHELAELIPHEPTWRFNLKPGPGPGGDGTKIRTAPLMIRPGMSIDCKGARRKDTAFGDVPVTTITDMGPFTVGLAADPVTIVVKCIK